MSVDFTRLQFLLDQGRRVDFYLEYADMILAAGGPGASAAYHQLQVMA